MVGCLVCHGYCCSTGTSVGDRGRAFHDAETGARLGTFDFFGPYGPGPIVDGASGRALVVSRGLNQQVICAFDVNTYSRIDTNLVNGSFGTFNDFERWSADGLALSGSTGVVI